MQKIRPYISSRKYVLIVVFLFFLIRLPLLDSTFLLYDERDTILTQYSLAKTGKDLYGKQFPLSFSRISPQAPILAMYYGVPFWFLGLPKTVSMSRFIYLLPTTLFPLLIFELIFAITKQKKLSYLTSIVLSFSPWIYHISRLALEINIAFPLFLGAVLFQIKKKHLVAYLLYALTFFSYQGIRPLILPIMLYVEVLFYLNKEKIRTIMRRSLIHIFIFVLLFLLSIAIEGNMSSRSSSEIVFLNNLQLKQEVDHNRFISQSPSILKSIFDNKIIVTFDHFFENFIKGIDFSYLFKYSDYVPIYSNGFTGQFYPLLFVFLLIGLFSLGFLKNSQYFYISFFTFIGLISSVINIYSLTFSIRSLFSSIGFSFIISLGIIEGIKILKKIYRFKPMYWGVAGIITLILLFQVASFFYRYSYQRPIWQSELFNENERILSIYLSQNGNKKYTVKTPNAFTQFMSYIFLIPLDNNKLSTIQKTLQKNTLYFTLDNLAFIECRDQQISFFTKPSHLIIEERCLSAETKFYIRSKHISFTRLDYAGYNPLDTQKRLKYYIFD